MLEIHTISSRWWDAFVIENISRWGHNFNKHTFIICSVLHVPVSNVQHFMTIFFRKSVKNDKSVCKKKLQQGLYYWHAYVPSFLFEKLLEMILDFLHIGIYTEIWYLEFIRKMFEHIAQFLKIIIQVLSCRLQYNNPVYSFNLTRKRGVFLKIFFFTIEHLPKSLTWEVDNRN